MMNCFGRGFQQMAAVAAAICLACGCAKGTAGEAAGKDPVAEKPQAERKSAEPPGKDPFAVPDGPPDKQIEFLQGLSKLRPDAPDEKSAREFNAKVAPAAMAAAEKILAGKPNDEQSAIAAQVMAEVLSMKAQAGDREAAAQLQALPERFEKAGFAPLARRLRAALLREQMVEAVSADVEQLKKVVDAITKFIASGPAGPAEAGLAMTVSQVLERSGHRELAIAANRDLAKLLEKSKDRAIARLAKSLEGMARRLELPGRAMPLEGTTLDGKPLSWDTYRGKVVLVQFWATWCAPCRQEIKSIQKTYEAYHGRGFEVVGISVDEDREELEAFVKENHLPWPVVFDQALRGEDDKSMATRYGVMSIPQVILVNKEGIVVSTEVRGPALGEHLEKLLGPPEVKKEADSGK
jgi:peroxiredoxin